MSNYLRHNIHLVDESPWPLLASLGGLGITTGLLRWFHLRFVNLFIQSLTFLILVRIQWWRDVGREGSYAGQHSILVETGLRWGMVLFIISEVFFFIRFFWAFFHRRLAVNIELGGVWPPAGLIVFSAFGVPLLNTVILLSSGVRITWRHHRAIGGNHTQIIKGLGVTVALGAYFTLLQGIEYIEARFSFSDCAYGSTFFLATGFHGLHVMVGTRFLLVCLFRGLKGVLRHRHHLGFEAAAWYWHFVDVVWLFLYLIVYWWGGS